MGNSFQVRPQHGDERIAQEIELLYRSVVHFRSFLGELTPRQRAWLAEGLPWRDEGSEIWIDFEAWVQTTLFSLRDPAEGQEAHGG